MHGERRKEQEEENDEVSRPIERGRTRRVAHKERYSKAIIKVSSKKNENNSRND